MSGLAGGVVTIRGERWITLEEVAECYRVEVTWVEDVYEHGLLGRGEHVGESIAVAVAMLERVARVLQLERRCGVNLAGIVLLLEPLER